MKLSLGLSPRDYSVAGGAVAYDTDAQAYFNANTSITSAADKNAINTFYLGLKSDGIYTKIKAMYLPIWGSAAACKWNLVNPVDSNAAFRLTFSTGWTFSSGGMTPLNAYADTNFSFSTILNQNSISISAYSRTNKIGSPIIGVVQASVYSQIYPYQGSNTWGVEGINSTSYMTATTSDSLGFYQAIRQNSTTVKIVKNNTITSYSDSSTGNQSINIYLGARNQNNTANSFDTRQIAFSSIGDGLTDAEATNFYNRVQTLMTYFGINV